MKAIILVILIIVLGGCTKEPFIDVKGEWQLKRDCPTHQTYLNFTTDSCFLTDVTSGCIHRTIIIQVFSYSLNGNEITLRQRHEGYNCKTVWGLYRGGGGQIVMKTGNLVWVLIPINKNITND